jgi:hypothetical protein
MMAFSFAISTTSSPIATGRRGTYGWTSEQAVGKEASLARMVATSSLSVRGMRDDAGHDPTFKAATFAGATRRF